MLIFAKVDGLSPTATTSYKFGNMDNPELAFLLITKLTPKPLCDDCLATLSGISPRQQVNIIARSLALTTDFDRQDGKCSECGGDKLVTRSLRHT